MIRRNQRAAGRGPRITVRRATTRDLDVLVAQRRGMFEDMGQGDEQSLARHDRDFRRWLVPRLRRAEYVAFVALCGTQAVAGAAVWLQERQPRPGFAGGKMPLLLSVYTDARFRRLGLATRATKAAMDWCRAQGFASMTLHASKKGRGVYQGLGWRRTWEMGVKLSPPKRSRRRRTRQSTTTVPSRRVRSA